MRELSTSPQGEVTRVQIGDESIYLRINELKCGKVQFTDATNAERLMREHGDSIRYLAAWKKWLVWDGTHWKTDESGVPPAGLAKASPHIL